MRMRFKITVEDYSPTVQWFRLYKRRWFKWHLIQTTMSYNAAKRVAVTLATRSKEQTYEVFTL